jgi:hypothetical protein
MKTGYTVIESVDSCGNAIRDVQSRTPFSVYLLAACGIRPCLSVSVLVSNIKKNVCECLAMGKQNGGN